MYVYSLLLGGLRWKKSVEPKMFQVGRQNETSREVRGETRGWKETAVVFLLFFLVSFHQSATQNMDVQVRPVEDTLHFENELHPKHDGVEIYKQMDCNDLHHDASARQPVSRYFILLAVTHIHFPLSFSWDEVSLGSSGQFQTLNPSTSACLVLR